LNILSFLTSM